MTTSNDQRTGDNSGDGVYTSLHVCFAHRYPKHKTTSVDRPPANRVGRTFTTACSGTATYHLHVSVLEDMDIINDLEFEYLACMVRQYSGYRLGYPPFPRPQKSPTLYSGAEYIDKSRQESEMKGEIHGFMPSHYTQARGTSHSSATTA